MTVVFRTRTPEGVVAQLIHDAQVGALGIYADDLPERAVWPCVTYRLVSNIGQRSHRRGAAAFARSRVQVDTWTHDPDSAKQLALDITAALVEARGEGIRSIAHIAQRSLNDPKRNVGRQSIDFEVWHDEPLA